MVDYVLFFYLWCCLTIAYMIMKKNLTRQIMSIDVIDQILLMWETLYDVSQQSIDIYQNNQWKMFLDGS